MSARRSIPGLLLCFGVLAVAAPPAQAQSPYFPVEVGLTATFVAEQGATTLVSRFTAPETLVDGTVAIRRENTVSGLASDLYWNYWTESEGRTYLHGFWRPEEGIGVVYDPPLVWVDATIGVGSSWSRAADVLDFETGEDVGTGPSSASLQGDVASSETVIEWRASGPGLVASASPGDAEDAWFRLTDSTVGRRSSSWGDLKSRFTP